MKKIITALALSTAATLSGCVVYGHDFDETKASQIQKGVTTETELTQMFGQPTAKRTQDGVTSLTWVCTTRFGHQKAIAVDLDKDGKVAKVASELH